MKCIIVIIALITSCIGSEPKEPTQGELIVLWEKQTNLIDAPRAQPLVIQDSKVIYTGELELVAIDINTGDEIWRGTIDNENELICKTLVYDTKRKRIIANHKNDVKAWNSENGESIFTLTADNGVQSFRLGQHAVLENGYGIVGNDVDAYVLESDGSIRFSVDFDFASAGLAFSVNKLYMTMGKTINGGLTKGKIIALNVQNGDSLWAFDTDKGGFTNVAPIVEDGILYAGTIGNSPTDIAVALNAQTGEVIWENEEDYFFTRNTSLGPDHFYINTGGSLAALDKETGQLAWRVEWLSTDFNKPIYLEGYVYHVRDAEMLIIDDKTGEVVHREPVPDGTFFWHIAASSDKIFAQTSSQLIAYEPWHLRD